MMTKRLLGLVALALTLSVASVAITPADASASLRSQYLSHYKKVAKKYGKRKPGRNIVRYGLRRGDQPSRHTIAVSLRTFKRWLAPPPAVAMPGDTHSGNDPPGTAGGGYAIPRDIVMCESGGDYGAVNPTNPNRPAGAYQIITSTWLAYGGGKYAPTADSASPAQQDEIAAAIYSGGAGRGQWAC